MDNKNRDFKGVWIKKEIWLNTNLSLIEKILIVEIDSLDNSEKGCFASNEYLANFVNLSEGRVANIISDLKKRDFLNQLFFDGRNRGLRINKHKCESSFHENVKPDLTKKLKQNTQNREHINTVNKTINNTDLYVSENKFSSTHENKMDDDFYPISDFLNTEKKEKEKSSGKKEKEKTPSEIYDAYATFCSFHESVSNAVYPKTATGNYILTPIDARNIKLLITWLKSVGGDNVIFDLQAFLQGCWSLNDKYIKDNFSIGILYRQCTQLYAKIQNLNPFVNRESKAEKRMADAAEFLKRKYGSEIPT